MSSMLRGSRVKNARSMATTTYNVSKVLRNYPIGMEIYGYKINKVMAVPELSLTAVDLTHSKTGAQHLHIDRQDKNNVFSVIFKTNPPNKTGVPHILEHTTLCGSYTYPVRDPFFKMLNRSLSNFMNAMTGHDYTFYPFATTNRIDYENLRKVYLSSVFEPLLKQEDFYQEGWRLENEDPNDAESPLTFKGVVYNEMKGQVSNSSYLFYIKFQESIYPSLQNSGGDPAKITDLEYEDLVDFHVTNYHPSNSRTFTYGDIPLNEHLEKLDAEFKTFGKRSVRNVIKKPIELNENQEVIAEGPVDPMIDQTKQFKSSISWFVGSPQDVYESFQWKILTNLLIDGHSSPFYKKLIEKGVGDEYSVNSGFDSTTALNSLTLGLQGLTEENSNNLQSIIIEIFHEIVAELKTNPHLFDQRVEAILHQLEISKKDKKSDFGMGLLYSIAPNWVNEVDPFELLAFDDLVSQFKIDYNGELFVKLIEQNILDKPHFKFIMKPIAEYETQVLEEEQTRLAKLTKNLDVEDKEIIFKRGQFLQEKQNEQEDLSCLPTLTMKDIPRKGEDIELNFSVASESENSIQKRITDTNGLTYFRAHKPIHNVPAKYYKYLPLFSSCLLNLGTHSKTMSQLEDEIKLYTGGLNAGVSVTPSPTDYLQPTLKFSISGMATNSQTPKIFELWDELLKNTDFQNVDKLTTLIKSLASNNISGLAESGHSYARNYASSALSPIKYIDDSLNGIGQIRFLNELAKNLDSLKTDVIPILEEIQNLIVNRNSFKYSLVTDGSAVSANEELINKFDSGLANVEVYPNELNNLMEEFNNQETKTNTLVKLPFQVNYASLALPGVSYINQDGASLQVLSQIITYKHLHKEIREKGGAYGGGLSYSGVDGILGFYSYRDPNPSNSLETFSKAGEFAVSKDWNEVDLQEAKLTLFQSIDAPVNVSTEGSSHFGYGITNEMRQTRREMILGVTNEDLHEVAQKYLINAEKKSVCVVGSLEVGDDWEVIEMGEE